MVVELPAYACAKLKLDQFFLQWVTEHPDVVRGSSLALPAWPHFPASSSSVAHHLQHLQITSLLEDAVAGKPLRGPSFIPASGPTPLSPSTVHAIFAATVSPLGPAPNQCHARYHCAPAKVIATALQAGCTAHRPVT